MPAGALKEYRQEVLDVATAWAWGVRVGDPRDNPPPSPQRGSAGIPLPPDRDRGCCALSAATRTRAHRGAAPPRPSVPPTRPTSHHRVPGSQPLTPRRRRTGRIRFPRDACALFGPRIDRVSSPAWGSRWGDFTRSGRPRAAANSLWLTVEGLTHRVARNGEQGSGVTRTATRGDEKEGQPRWAPRAASLGGMTTRSTRRVD